MMTMTPQRRACQHAMAGADFFGYFACVVVGTNLLREGDFFLPWAHTAVAKVLFSDAPSPFALSAKKVRCPYP